MSDNRHSGSDSCGFYWAYGLGTIRIKSCRDWAQSGIFSKAWQGREGLRLNSAQIEITKATKATKKHKHYHNSNNHSLFPLYNLF